MVFDMGSSDSWLPIANSSGSWYHAQAFYYKPELSETFVSQVNTNGTYSIVYDDYTIDQNGLVNFSVDGLLGLETFNFASQLVIRNQTFLLVNNFNDKLPPANDYYDAS